MRSEVLFLVACRQGTTIFFSLTFQTKQEMPSLQKCEVISQSFLDFLCPSEPQHHHGYEMDTEKKLIVVKCGLSKSWRINIGQGSSERQLQLSDLQVLSEYVARWKSFAFVTVFRCNIACESQKCRPTHRFCNRPILACRSVLTETTSLHPEHRVQGNDKSAFARFGSGAPRYPVRAIRTSYWS